MKKPKQTISTRLVLRRETLANLVVSGGTAHFTLDARCRTVRQGCQTTSCGVGSCHGCDQ
jgi:hypothetical protein